MNYKKLILILSVVFIGCEKSNSDSKNVGVYYQVPKGMQMDIPERIHQLIKNKSLHLIDSLLVKTSVLEEIGFGYTYSNDELGYHNTYRIDTTHYKIIKIGFDLDLNVVDWDTVIYVP